MLEPMGDPDPAEAAAASAQEPWEASARGAAPGTREGEEEDQEGAR